jgi:hypothetical protein
VKHLQSVLGHEVDCLIQARHIAARKYITPDEIVRFPLLLVADKVEDTDAALSQAARDTPDPVFQVLLLGMFVDADRDVTVILPAIGAERAMLALQDIDPVAEPLSVDHALHVVVLRLDQPVVVDDRTVGLGGEQGEVTPTGSDLDQAAARLERQLLADVVVLVVLGLIQGRRVVAPVSAAVPEGLTQDDFAELYR